MNKPFRFSLLIMLFWVSVSQAREVTDQLGRRMIVPDDPKRVVSFAPSITEIIYAIGQEHRLVGVTRFSNYPPQTAVLPKVGTYIQLNLEKIVSLKPDLCIAVKDGNPIDAVRRIESFGIPVYAVDPRNIPAVIETIKEIGIILNAGEQSVNAASRMEERIETVKLKAKEFEHRPGVFFQIGVSPIVSVGTNTFIHELITLAGGINLTAGPVPYPRFTREQVIALSPEVFIITSMTRETVFEEILKEWRKWQTIPAVRNNRIHLVDSDLFDRAGPRLADGLETLFPLIHPDSITERQRSAGDAD